jgi:EAL domain-containing protein (putative c-di-GMP-specific phosphodiesterase class I)
VISPDDFIPALEANGLIVPVVHGFSEQLAGRVPSGTPKVTTSRLRRTYLANNLISLELSKTSL